MTMKKKVVALILILTLPDLRRCYVVGFERIVDISNKQEEGAAFQKRIGV